MAIGWTIGNAPSSKQETFEAIVERVGNLRSRNGFLGVSFGNLHQLEPTHG